MTGWIVFGAIAAFLFLFLMMPLRICFTYREKTELTVRVGVIPIRILSDTKKDKKVLKERTGSDSTSKPNFFKQLYQSGGISGLVTFFKEVMRLISRLTGGITRRLVLETFDVYVAVGADDAAQTAELYGKACAVVYPAAEALCRLMKNKKKRIEIRPDFLADKTVSVCKLVIRIRVITLLHRALQAAFGFVKLLLCQLIKNKKAVQTNRSGKEAFKCPDNTLKA